jgi:dUTP pyrophosphatase
MNTELGESLMELKIKKLNPAAVIPSRVHTGDLGFDLFALETVAVQAGQTVLAKTGIACGFPKGWGGIVKGRSSQGKAGIDVLGGVIDNGYTGEVGVLLHNNSDDVIIYGAGNKIGQLILVPVFEGGTIEVEELGETTRGAQGFGSSGQ